MVLKKGNLLQYHHNPNSEEHYKLKVVKEVNWGGDFLFKCKVTSKDWYDFVYISELDFYTRKVRVIRG